MRNRPARATMAAAKAILATLLAACFALACLLTAAEAQEQRPRRTLLQMLFGGPEPDVLYRPAAETLDTAAAAQADFAPPPRSRWWFNRMRRRRCKSCLMPRRSSSSVISWRAAWVTGWTMPFPRRLASSSRRRSTVASGLVRQDYYNWPQQLPAMMDQLKPAMVVVDDRRQ